MSLKFLNLKGWHPSNKQNQKRIWIAEQKAKDFEAKEKEAARELKEGEELRKFQKLANSKGDREAMDALNSQSMNFMYAAPPGLDKDRDANLVNDDEEDAAVTAFRKKVQRRAQPTGAADGPSMDVRRNLERYVGRRQEDTLTIQDQVERFPMLKDAPVEGDYTSAVRVNFKPMGVRLRNVRCLRCGEWGHQSGDRECSLRDFNPHDAARQALEDPVTYMNKVSTQYKQDLVLKKAALPLEMMPAGSSKEYEMLPSGEDSSNPEEEFLTKLSTKEKKLLLKRLRKEDGSDAKQKKKKKHKKEKKRKSSVSLSSDSDEGSTSHHKRHANDKDKRAGSSSSQRRNNSKHDAHDSKERRP